MQYKGMGLGPCMMRNRYTGTKGEMKGKTGKQAKNGNRKRHIASINTVGIDLVNGDIEVGRVMCTI